MPAANAFARLRQTAEQKFSRWGEVCHDHPWRIIAVAAAALGFLAAFLPTLTLDMSTQSFLREDDPARIAYDRFQQEFGRDDRIILVLHARDEVISEAALRRLQTVHQALEEIPQVASVESLVNARLTIGRDDELIVRELLEDWPADSAEFNQLRKLVYQRALYRDNFISADRRSTLLIVTPDAYTAEVSGARQSLEPDELDFAAGFADEPFAETPELAENATGELLTDAELFAMVEAAMATAQTHSDGLIQLSVAGPAYLTQQLTVNMTRDMAVFSVLGMLVIASLLMLIFRRWVMVVLPVGLAMLSVMTTFALMAFMGKTVTQSSQILPSLLLAVGVGNAVHIFTVFFQATDRGLNKRESLAYALGHSGLAVVLTGLTTAGGLASFMTADMRAVADIGVVSPLGILCALALSLTLLPALIAVTPFREEGLKDDASGPLQRFLLGCADLATTHPVKVVSAWGALIGVALLLAAQIKPSHNPIHWFEPDNALRQSMELVNAQFGGASFLEIVVDSGQTDGLHDPELLHAVDAGLDAAAQVKVESLQLGPTSSLLDVNKELHQALNGNDPAFYVIPENRQLIAQELLLLENSGNDDLDDLVDTNFQKMRITAKLPLQDSMHYPAFLHALEQALSSHLGDLASFTLTGVTPLFSATVGYIINDTVRAYLVAFAVITPLMILLVGSVRVGLISMIPNLAPIILTLALMQLVGLPLDMFSTLIGSIALGLAVDDTIHFMHNYQRYHARLGDSAAAVRETLRTTGKALTVTTLVLSAGFLLNCSSQMVSLQNFGLLTSFCISMALLADLLLAPALVTLLARQRPHFNI